MQQNISARVFILGLGLMLSVGLNVALSVRAAQQRAALDAERRSERPLAGQRLDGFDARDPAGAPARVSFGTDPRPTVLYSFRPGCAWCDRNLAAIVALHAQLGGRYRFIGVSMDAEGLGDYLARHPLPFESVTGLDAATVAAYQLGGTPRTLVLAPDGTVTDNWFGAYTGGVREEIERSLGVRLPDSREGAGS